MQNQKKFLHQTEVHHSVVDLVYMYTQVYIYVHIVRYCEVSF
jgi:hypothetical protein